MARPRMVLSGALLVVVIIVAATTDALDWIGIGAGSGGSGEKGSEVPAETLPGDAMATSPEASTSGPEHALQPKTHADPSKARPLQIVIKQHDYFIAGEKLTLDDAIAKARKVPVGAGPAVVINRDPTSRASAEEALERLLLEHGIAFLWANTR